jgi:ribosomal silencing factor RsfS
MSETSNDPMVMQLGGYISEYIPSAEEKSSELEHRRRVQQQYSELIKVLAIAISEAPGANKDLLLVELYENCDKDMYNRTVEETESEFNAWMNVLCYQILVHLYTHPPRKHYNYIKGLVEKEKDVFLKTGTELAWIEYLYNKGREYQDAYACNQGNINVFLGLPEKRVS